MTGWIVITLGDITGIGPEVTLKALAAELPADETRYLLVGDAGCVDQLNLKLGLNLHVQPYRKPIAPGRVFVFNPFPQSLLADLTPGYPAAARAALASLTDAAQRCLRREMDALVTAPVNKEAILRTGQP
ncbi:MAG TPA: 4-hydroxythreonine-4-phosphate dehydrogenase PdxA, partial [Verrucomicrobiae bacterium]